MPPQGAQIWPQRGPKRAKPMVQKSPEKQHRQVKQNNQQINHAFWVRLGYEKQLRLWDYPSFRLSGSRALGL